MAVFSPGARLVPQDTKGPQNVFHIHLSAKPMNAAPVPDAITATLPVGWTSLSRTERRPMPPYLKPLRRPNRLDGQGN
ncbi:hypothetical protein AVEN_158937-1 [Araneus ventricosus]|uniref:Uncharacterized protein n=1 Tax=Araneus ventricosus TaxID=182803 RepID=A0A4Y2BBI7_ARAVE|nr:hypothetical protein AVEN_158937-1 [Araneus ventricosus]